MFSLLEHRNNGNHNYFSLMTTKCNNINSKPLCIHINMHIVFFTIDMIAYAYMPFHIFKTYFICIERARHGHIFYTLRFMFRYYKGMKCKAWIYWIHKPNTWGFFIISFTSVFFLFLFILFSKRTFFVFVLFFFGWLNVCNGLVGVDRQSGGDKFL